MAFRQLLTFSRSRVPFISPAAPSLHAFSAPALNQFTAAWPYIAITYPATVSFSLPSLIQDLWESVLRAVPKKKTSHSKKRHRQMAGKALKDVTNLNQCSGCGRVKRAHILCPYCVLSIRKWFKDGALGKPAERVTRKLDR